MVQINAKLPKNEAKLFKIIAKMAKIEAKSNQNGPTQSKNRPKSKPKKAHFLKSKLFSVCSSHSTIFYFKISFYNAWDGQLESVRTSANGIPDCDIRLELIFEVNN